MASLKLSRLEKFSAFCIGIAAGLILFLLVRDPVLRLVYSSAAVAFILVLSILPVFKMSYRFVYSTEKPVEEVMEDVKGEEPLIAKVVKERGIENVEKDGDELKYTASTSILHEKLGFERNVKIEITEQDGRTVGAREYLNEQLIGISKTSVSEEDGEVMVEETYSREKRANAAVILGFKMQRRTVEKVLERNDYTLDDSELELGI